MSNELLFNEDEKDCLQELMNVSYGAATAAIADIINAFAILSVPVIEIIDAKNLKDYLIKNLDLSTPHLIATQLLNGELSGENLFLIDTKSAISMAEEFDIDEDEISEEDLHDIVLETTNILSSSIVSSLVSELGSNTTFSPPEIKKIDGEDDITNDFTKLYTKVIIISTELTFEEKNIHGKLMMLTTDKSISFIKKVLNKILDEF
ncbi:MAG TPA: chemotaxis protein CheC [Arcobacter sp.]|nr:chemotaxis protein CheC [Arcobacter sp.]HIP56243.1 chemotaxis protein CheC [Arcobacter sp.]